MGLNANAIVALEDLRDALKIQGTTQDAFLEQVLNAVSDFVEGSAGTGRRLTRTTYTGARFSGHGGQRLEELEWPITTLTSVAIGGVTQTLWMPGTAGEPTAKEVVLFDDADPKLSRSSLFRWGGWPKGVGNIAITYVAGYKDEPSALFPVPIDLKQAVLIMCRHWYYLRDRQKQGIDSVSSGGQTVRYLNIDVPKEARFILESYRRGPVMVAV